MKKLLGVLLAIAMSWPVNAAVLKNVEVIGEIQTIASDVRVNTDVTDAQVYNTDPVVRVMAGLSADLVEDVTANLLFQYANTWGNDVSAGNNMQNYWDGVRLVNANVVLHNLLCAFDVTVGRQFYGDEDSAVIYVGPNHYNAEFAGYASSLDAVKLTYADDVKAFTAIAGRFNNTHLMGLSNNAAIAPLHAATPTFQAFEIYGADFKFHMNDALTAQVYGYDVRNYDTNYLVDGAVENYNDDDSGIYGAKLGFNAEAFRASAEYARNFGGHRLIKEHEGTGDMVKADVAMDINAITARGTFLYARENFWAFGNYTPGLLVGHALGGAIFNYTPDHGVRMFNLGFDMKPAEKWTVSLDGYSFQGREGHHAATWEADLTAKYAHNEYVELFAGAGYAKFGNDATSDFNKDNLGKDNVKGQIGMLIKF